MELTVWLETYTGLTIAGADTGRDPDALEKAFQRDAERKRVLLQKAWAALTPVKAAAQAAFANDLKVKGEGEKTKRAALKVKGSQLDEADYTEYKASEITLSTATSKAIADFNNAVTNQGQLLNEARKTDSSDPLFSKPELTEAYWFPLTRERILPETLIADLYSKTKVMIEETNELYLDAIEAKAESGELTPEGNGPGSLLKSGGSLASAGASIAGAFAGTPHAETAAELLNTIATVLNGAGDGYDKVKAKKYADGANVFLGTLKVLTSAALGAAGVDDKAIEASDLAFKAGSGLILAGKEFARGASGAEKGTAILAGVLQVALEGSEALATKDGDDKAAAYFKVVIATAPAALRNLGKTESFIKKLREGNVAGVMDDLCAFSKDALMAEEAIRSAADAGDETDEEREVDEARAEQIETYIDMAGNVVKGGYAVVMAIKRGEFMAALDGLVGVIGQELGTALDAAGLPPDEAKKIAALYEAATSTTKVLKALTGKKPDVRAALEALGDGIVGAFEELAPDNPEMKEVARGLKMGFGGLVAAAEIEKLYAERKYEAGVKAFMKAVNKQLEAAFDLVEGAIEIAEGDEADQGNDADEGDDADEGEDAEGDDPEKGDDTETEEASEKDKAESKERANALKKSLKGLTQTAGSPANKAKIEKNIDAAFKRVEAEKDVEAATFILDAADAEISEAEQTGREASDIDALIADIQRDRMIMKIALQIAQGGAAFLSQFLPGLGAASAAIRLVANLLAAAKRARQLQLWVQTHGDLIAAQSALSSSAQNFVTNQAAQFSHYSIQAATDAADMIGHVLKDTGAATWGAGHAVGIALSASARATAKIEEVCKKVYDAKRMNDAWKLTQRALKNPANRRLGLQAREQNPTLAKYSIAWGAVKLKDPLARAAMRACDLNEATLENENSNVDKVVAYLEAFYADDDKLYRLVEDQAKWVPAGVALQLRYWMKFKQAAVKKYPRLPALGSAGELEGALGQMSADLTQLTADELVAEAALVERIGVLLTTYSQAAAIEDAEQKRQLEAVVTLLSNQGLQKARLVRKVQSDQSKKQAADEVAARKLREKVLNETGAALLEIEAAIAEIDTFDVSDDVTELQEARTRSAELLADVGHMASLKADAEVQKAAAGLKAAVAQLERLIVLSDMAMA